MFYKAGSSFYSNTQSQGAHLYWSPQSPTDTQDTDPASYTHSPDAHPSQPHYQNLYSPLHRTNMVPSSSPSKLSLLSLMMISLVSMLVEYTQIASDTPLPQE